MKLIDHIPLRILFLLWLIWPRQRAMNAIQLDQYGEMLVELVHALPMPQTPFQRLALSIILEWIYGEQAALWKLRQAGVGNIVTGIKG